MSLQKDVDVLKRDFRKHELDQRALDARQDEQIKTLFHSVMILRNVMYTFALIMLLALIYGALGPDGFNAVRKAAPIPQVDGNVITYAIPCDFDHRLRRAA